MVEYQCNVTTLLTVTDHWCFLCGRYVGKDEELLLKRLTDKVVLRGPRVVFPSPFTTLKYTKRKATTGAREGWEDTARIRGSIIRQIRNLGNKYSYSDLSSLFFRFFISAIRI